MIMDSAGDHAAAPTGADDVSVPRRARLHAIDVDHDPERPKRRIAFCHGLFGQGKNWTTIAKQLADDYAVTLIDMPNHGRSPWTAELSYPLMADLVADFLRSSAAADGNGAQGWTLVGHSMGGKIAMTLALRHPELVDALCVVDIAPVDYAELSEFSRYVQGLRAIDLSTLPSRNAADEQLRAAVPDAGVRSFLLQNLRRSSDSTTDDAGWHWQPNLRLLGDHLDVLSGWPDPEGRSYRGPTLWVAGADSSYVLSDYTPAMRQLFPQVRSVKIKNAAHWVHSDQPAVFTAVLRDFLRRTTPAVS